MANRVKKYSMKFNMKGVEAQGKLEAEKPMSMCSHKISLTSLSDIDQEVIDWIKMAFEQAG